MNNVNANNGNEAWKDMLTFVEFGKTENDDGSWVEQSNPYGMSDEAESIWNSYYTGEQSFMDDYEQYLQENNVDSNSTDQSNYFKNFVLEKFGLEANQEASDRLAYAIDKFSMIDKEPGLSHDDLTSSETAGLDLYIERPETYTDVIGKEPERTEQFNVNMDKAAYNECAKAKSAGQGTQEWQDARNKIAEAIAKEFNIPIYGEDGKYSDVFASTVTSVITHPDNQEILNQYYNAKQVDKLDENSSPDDVMDLFIGMNTDGIAANDDFAFSFTVPEHDILKSKVAWPEKQIHFVGGYNAKGEDRDPASVKAADDYMKSKLFSKLDVTGLNGAQLAQMIDILYDSDEKLSSLDFKGNDEKVITSIVHSILEASKNDPNINADTAIKRLAELDGYKLGDNWGAYYNL